MGKAIRLSNKAASQTGLRTRRKKIVRALIGGSQAQHNKAEPSAEDVRWSQDILTLRKAAEELAMRRHGGLTRSFKKKFPQYSRIAMILRRIHEGSSGRCMN